MAKKQTIASEIGSAIGAAAARAEQLMSSKPATKTTKPRTTAAKHSVTTNKKTAAAAEPMVEANEPEATASIEIAAIEIGREEIAKEAYLYWEARGFQGGSPAEDWARAEAVLKARAAKTMSAGV